MAPGSPEVQAVASVRVEHTRGPLIVSVAIQVLIPSGLNSLLINKLDYIVIHI